MINTHIVRKLKLAMLSFATAVAWIPVSFAQDTQGAQALDEIVITARKRAESIQDAPVSVAAFSAEGLERWNITNMTVLSDFTPSLVISEVGSHGGQFMSMRGINTGVANTIADQSISTLVDGVPFSQASITRIGKVDVEQVEVLKGPQALYFGKNTTGGIVSYRTVDPTDETEVQFKVGYENEAEETYVQALVSGALTDTLKARLVGRWSDMEGWLTNTAVAIPLNPLAPGPAARRLPQDEARFVRATLLWEPSDTFTMRTKVTHDTVDGLGNGPLSGYVACVGPTPAPSVFGYTNTDSCDPDSNTVGRQNISSLDVASLPRTNGEQRTFGEAELTFFTNEIQYAMSDNWDLVSVTGYIEQEYFAVGNFQPGTMSTLVGATLSMDQTHLTQEFRLQSALDGPLNYTFGAFYADIEQNAEFNVTFFGFPLTPADREPRSLDTTAYSVFGQVEWDLTDTLTLLAGVRWSEEEKDFTALADGVVVPVVNGDRTFDDVSPELTVQWRPNDDLMFYASYKEGFKSGGYNIATVRDLIAAPLDLSFDQETVDGFEAGMKSDWLDGRLRLNAGLWYYDYEALQLTLFDPASASLQVRNGGELNTQGLEFDMQYIPATIDGLSFNAAFAYTDAEFGDLLFDCYDGQGPAQGCNLTDPFGNPAQNLGGKRPLVAPEIQYNLGVVYEFAVTDNLLMELSASTAYSDDYLTENENHPLGVQDDFRKSNVGATLRDADNKWSLSFTGRNLEDEKITTVVGPVAGAPVVPIASGGGAADLQGARGRGKELWAEFTYNF